MTRSADSPQTSTPTASGPPDGLASAVSDQPPAPTWRDAQGAPARVLAAVWWAGVAVAAYAQAWRQGARQHAASVALGIVVSACVFAAVLSRASASDGPALIPDAAVAATAAAEYAARQTEPPPGEATAMPAPQTSELPAWLPATVTRWAPNIVAASERHGIPPALQGIVVLVESCGLATAGSSAGAQGLGQVVARYHPRILEGAGPFDPDHNLDVSAEYLAALWKKYGGDVDKVAASYNGGHPGNINPETNSYRRWVAGMWRDRDTADGGPMFAEWMAAVQATPGNLCERAEAS